MVRKTTKANPVSSKATVKPTTAKPVVETTPVVESTPVPKVAVVAPDAPATKPVAKPTPVVDDSSFGPTTAMGNVASALTVLTAAGGHTPKDISSAQVTLYYGISSALRSKDDATFKHFMGKLLAFINADDTDTFGARRAYRGFNMLPGLSTEQASEFEVLLRIFIDTAEPETRHLVAKAVNWDQVSGHLISVDSDTVLGRLRDYYNVV